MSAVAYEAAPHPLERDAQGVLPVAEELRASIARELHDVVAHHLSANAVAETFFATLMKELVNRRAWPWQLELQSATFEYIEAIYNRQRRHSTLNMLSPANYEQLRLSPLGG